jgi:hypothetical protein
MFLSSTACSDGDTIIVAFCNTVIVAFCNTIVNS